MRYLRHFYNNFNNRGGVCIKGKEKIYFRLYINRVVDWSIKLWSLWLGTLAADGPHTKDMLDTIVNTVTLSLCVASSTFRIGRIGRFCLG